MSQSLPQLQSFLHRHIPLSKAMAIQLTHYDGQSLNIAAPLDENRNHQGTAFGGSIASLGILAGWCLVNLKLLEMKLDTYLVIQQSQVKYLSAITGRFEADARLPTDDIWANFEERMLRRGKGRVDIASTIRSNSVRAATHVGTYVAIKTPDAS